VVRAVGLEPTTHGLKVRVRVGIRVCPLAFIVPIAHALPVLAQRRSTLFAVRPSADVRHVRASRRLCRQNCRQSDGSDLGRPLHDSPLECGFRESSFAAYSNLSRLVGCCLSDRAPTKCGQFQNCRTSKPSCRTGSTVKHRDDHFPCPYRMPLACFSSRSSRPRNNGLCLVRQEPSSYPCIEIKRPTRVEQFERTGHLRIQVRILIRAVTVVSCPTFVTCPSARQVQSDQDLAGFFRQLPDTPSRAPPARASS